MGIGCHIYRTANEFMKYHGSTIYGKANFRDLVRNKIIKQKFKSAISSSNCLPIVSFYIQNYAICKKCMW